MDDLFIPPIKMVMRGIVYDGLLLLYQHYNPSYKLINPTKIPLRTGDRALITWDDAPSIEQVGSDHLFAIVV